ncbi:MAG: bifunctional (p)ppGpp synthetase/guanosine-3',5'-bis(diphosphate) 3'-pyrophosphohydrolase [Vampirovibrionales bacterium]|nr:bifunctional (p)ppGpp synthetase/guanosine-3',5'-bis(diphosphate) 3'-pyrophosphohydrolase [Vampirovibrionales bacterium]
MGSFTPPEPSPDAAAAHAGNASMPAPVPTTENNPDVARQRMAMGDLQGLAGGAAGDASDDVTLENGRLKEDILFDELAALIKTQNRQPADLELLELAFDYGRKKHAHQRRRNGENYITHPVTVATILAKIPADTPTVVAAILHDVLEDTDGTPAEIKTQFGEDVLKLVEGVTKLGKFKFDSAQDAESENFRRMFLAMADDIRIILLKLADRLHNMRTLHHLKPEKQLRIAKETLEIFAPLANRLGMGNIRAELQDLSLKYLDPEAYIQIKSQIEATRQEREAVIDQVSQRVGEQLMAGGTQAKIYGRVKNLYSIYSKMRRQQKSLEDVFDISALRIIVNSEKECYEALGIIHHAYTPVPGQFKDYIAIPKSNFYQSLHTTVIGPKGRPLEVQIRTQDMHRLAEYGVAAHWRYKESGNSVVANSESERQFSWLKQMLELEGDADSARQYVDSVKLDLFQDEVFVFTPRGRVVSLPRGATPIDFAYRIHTEVGHTCAGALVNGKPVNLSYELRNGEIIEVMTNKKGQPRLDWINLAQTQTAKSRIRQWFKKHYREEHQVQGKTLLEAELTRNGFDQAVKSGKLEKIAQELNYQTLDDLYLALGYGEINLPRVLNRLKREQTTEKHEPLLRRLHSQLQQHSAQKSPSPQQAKKSGSAIEGLKGMLYALAKCCNPVLGEPIVGIVSRHRGVIIHREDCPNTANANPGRMMMVNWDNSQPFECSSAFAVILEIIAIDRIGVLKDILNEVVNTKTNLSDAKIKRIDPDHTAVIEISIDVFDLAHLDRVMSAIKSLPDVLTVKRQQFRARR